MSLGDVMLWDQGRICSLLLTKMLLCICLLIQTSALNSRCFIELPTQLSTWIITQHFKHSGYKLLAYFLLPNLLLPQSAPHYQMATPCQWVRPPEFLLSQLTETRKSHWLFLIPSSCFHLHSFYLFFWHKVCLVKSLTMILFSLPCK